MKPADIARYLEELAPRAYQEDYDNAGLITSHHNPITGILVSLDCIEEVVDEAIEKKCNMIVAHHPIVFKGLKQITGKNYVERTLIKAIKHDIAIYAIHTNLDNVHRGVNRKIADMLKLQDTRILNPKSGLLAKLYTFVPHDQADKVRDALFAAGAGNIGKYDQCSYNQDGFGTFRAGEGTHPHVGEINSRHKEPEIKLEVIFPIRIKEQVISALKSAHPYEEVAYDIVLLANEYQEIGSGMVGNLAAPVALKDFLASVKKTFGCEMLRYSGKTKGSVSKVALCGGSGFFLLSSAIGSGADVYLTADVKYHEFFDAEDKITLVDIGHFESEQFTIDLLVDELKKKFTTFAVLKVSTSTNPVKYL